MTELKNLDLRLYGEIPKEITQAAFLIEHWAKKNGYVGWCLHGIADRSLVEDLQCRIKMVREAIQGSI